MSGNQAAMTEQDSSACPLVSVVIPTRRRAKLLAQCVGSILSQTVSDIEVIVVVDGADPATIDFLSKVHDDRLCHVTHTESRGVSNARNTGIDLATGTWVAFCDDDDVWAPTKLAAQVAALSDNPEAGWAIAGEVRVNEDSLIASYTEPATSEVIADALPHTNLVPAGCSGVIADRLLVMEVGGFDPRLSSLADRDLWIRLNWKSPVAVAPEPLVGYRDHAGAMTRQLRNIEQELDVIRTKYRDRIETDGRPFPSDRFYIWAYRRTFTMGDWRGGFEFLVWSPRFRRAMARWLRDRVMRRLGLARSRPQLQPASRVVTAADLPWLSPILGSTAP